MTDIQNNPHPVIPYTRIVGQDDLKLALELNYVNPCIGGVLIEGERGTGKSTIVRAFSIMMTGKLPVTLPINATEDRVIGGWQIDKLLEGEKKWQTGLLQQADKGVLYVDEVNLLDDHIVNLLLDASSTGILVIQRESEDKTIPVSLCLIGTMNPEEGELRPQLLDRFGLCVQVKAENDREERRKILQAVIDFDQDRNGVIKAEKRKLKQEKERIESAKKYLINDKKKFPREMAEICAQIAQEYQAEGHRGDYVLALASQAFATLKGEDMITAEHIRRIARMALQHRILDTETRERLTWQNDILERILYEK